MSHSISVIICAHNPRREYLNRVLAALRSQNTSIDDWELLVVDNASKEPLARLADLSWHARARVIVETDLGLTSARMRGIAESLGEVLVFVDDDNVLKFNYLEQVRSLALQWPQLGAWGGQQIPEFAAPPLPELIPYLSDLTIRSFEQDIWAKMPGSHDALPWGAGMCVRRAVACQWSIAVQQSQTRKMLGRTGASLASNEDIDLAMTAFDLGLGTGLFHSLILTHLIPADRLKEEYLLRLIEAKEFSYLLLMAARGRFKAPSKPTFMNYLRGWYHRIQGKHRLSTLMVAARRRGRARAVESLNGQAT